MCEKPQMYLIFIFHPNIEKKYLTFVIYTFGMHIYYSEASQ